MNRQLSLLAAVIVVALLTCEQQFAFAQGIFSTASTAGGDQDANVGLDATKTYFNAINVNGGNLTINGVNFTGNNGDATWSHANFPNPLVAENGSTITGQFGTLEDSFRYGNVPATQTVTLNGLTAGRTYITTFYNPNWDFGNTTARTSAITSTSGATFSYNENPGAALAMSLLRYTFVASGASENINFNNTGAAGSTHVYGFTTEQAFNNNWTSGANWSTAVWSVSQPNAAGDNANFTAQVSPTTINLDANRIVGHVQLDGANSWTISGANTLTLQPDVGGVSVLSTPTGSHTISAPIAGSNPIIKLGAGTLTLSGANTYTGTTTIGNGTLRLQGAAFSTTARTYSIASGAVLNLDGATDIATGITTISGGGTLRITGGALSASSDNRDINMNLGSGALIDIQSGAGLFNGGWQAINWTNNFADLQLDGSLDMWDGNAVRVDALMGSGTFTKTTAGGGNLLTVGVDNGSGTFSGTITNTAGTLNLTKTGTGTQILTGANTFNGLVTVSAGVLEFKTIANGSASSLGTGTGSGPNGRIVIGNGDLKFTGTTTQTVNRNIAWEAGATGALDASGASGAALVINDTANNPFNNPGARTFTFGGTNTDANTYSGVLANQASSLSSVAKKGTGNWILSGVNTYTGTTTVSNGTLELTANRTVSPGAITVGNTALQTGTLNIKGDLPMGSNPIVVGAGTTSVGIVNHSEDTVSFTGGDMLLIGNGGGSTSSGTYNLSGGTLSTGVTSTTRGVMLGVNAGASSASRITANFNLSGTGNISMGNAMLAVGRSDSKQDFTNNTYSQTAGTATFGTLTIGGATGGSADLNANFSVTGGTFTAASFPTLAAGNNNVATITIGGTGTVTLPAFPTARGTGSTVAIKFDGGTLRPTATSASYMPSVAGTTATITNNGAKIDTNGFDITIAQVLQNFGADNGTLIKNGAGTLRLNGTNTYTGSTQVNAGVLQAGAAAGGQAFGNLSAVTLANVAGATLDLNNFNQTIGSLAGGGTGGNVTLGIATLTTGGNNTSTTYDGVISGTGGFTKVGTGAQVLTNANTYTGVTNVNGGTLDLDGSINGSGEIVINRTAGPVNNTNGRLLIDTAGIRTLGNTGAGTGDVIVGDNSFGYLQHGAANPTSTNATSTVGRNLIVGRAAVGNGLVDVNNGTTLNVTNQLLIGNAVAVGTVNVNAGGTLNVNGNTTIVDGVPGTLNIAGVFTEDGDLIVGQSATGIVNQFAASTATINDNNDATGTVSVGHGSGSTGTYNMFGGTLTMNQNSATAANRLFVGNAGTGTFTQTGGTVHVGNSPALPGNLVVGSAGSSTGTYSLSGAGSTLNVYGNTTVGSASGTGGTDTFSQSNGTFNNYVDMNIGTSSGTGVYNLSGGTLNFQDTASNTQIATGLTQSTLAIGANGDFDLTGGTLMNVASIDVTSAPGGVFTQDGGRFVIGVDGVQNKTQNPLTVRAMTTIFGDYDQNPGSTLAIDVFGNFVRSRMSGENHGPTGPAANPITTLITDSDLVWVQGDATLDGILQINLNGVTPGAWAWYDVLVADNITITDGKLDLVGLTHWRIIRDPSDPTGLRQILQVAVPEPASIALWSGVALALAGVYFFRRRMT